MEIQQIEQTKKMFPHKLPAFSMVRNHNDFLLTMAVFISTAYAEDMFCCAIELSNIWVIVSFLLKLFSTSLS